MVVGAVSEVAVVLCTVSEVEVAVDAVSEVAVVVGAESKTEVVVGTVSKDVDVVGTVSKFAVVVVGSDVFEVAAVGLCEVGIVFDKHDSCSCVAVAFCELTRKTKRPNTSPFVAELIVLTKTPPDCGSSTNRSLSPALKPICKSDPVYSPWLSWKT